MHLFFMRNKQSEWGGTSAESGCSSQPQNDEKAATTISCGTTGSFPFVSVQNHTSFVVQPLKLNQFSHELGVWCESGSQTKWAKRSPILLMSLQSSFQLISVHLWGPGQGPVAGTRHETNQTRQANSSDVISNRSPRVGTLRQIRAHVERLREAPFPPCCPSVVLIELSEPSITFSAKLDSWKYKYLVFLTWMKRNKNVKSIKATHSCI